MKLFKILFSVLFSVLLTANAFAAEKWDMALAYGASNFHSANAAEFAKNVSEKSGGKLTIVTHPGGSLFKGGRYLGLLELDKLKLVKDLCLL